MAGLAQTGWIDAVGKPDYRLVIAQEVNDWWRAWLTSELDKPYIKDLEAAIAESHQDLEESAIFPPKHLVFRAFHYGPPNVVIIGQDPYHSPGAACGLSFSVPPGQSRPPSLLVIYKELVRSGHLGANEIPSHGDLSSWADQGVMLLNVALTVREGKAGSHMGLARSGDRGGWRQFTQAVIKRINDECPAGVVWLLWGTFAQSFANDINGAKHTIIRAGHPSPLNRSNPFIGSNCFSAANVALIAGGRPAIKWGSMK